jgi:hypothetical protein
MAKGSSGSNGEGKKQRIKTWRETRAANRQNPNTSAPN